MAGVVNLEMIELIAHRASQLDAPRVSLVNHDVSHDAVVAPRQANTKPSLSHIQTDSLAPTTLLDCDSVLASRAATNRLQVLGKVAITYIEYYTATLGTLNRFQACIHTKDVLHDGVSLIPQVQLSVLNRSSTPEPKLADDQAAATPQATNHGPG